ncbi:hypothetical protein PsYK624_024610 [Phanerochaete sordida]|uniref:Uncharacterized protein n=1 Tax=Phanerochaete sordida TaxID=48140 RepID=A0A9P3L8R2_9APHY|nr:hypothetical protein PsYK624_024610 [Phanerochaete sordida]
MSSSNTTLADVEAAFQLLSIEATLFATLSALFGVYFVLFILAIWATYRQSSKANARLRVTTIILFVDLAVHYIMRSITIGQSRMITPPSDEYLHWYIPIVLVACVTTTIAGLISDGLLVWRLYVIYGRSRWALWPAATTVILTGLVGFVSGFQNADAYHSLSDYKNRYNKISFQINAAWAWMMFATNTVMTMSIIGRIIYVTRKAKSTDGAHSRTAPYAKLLEAIIESALVTWFGLVFYGIATVAPQGHITTNMDVGFVMICIIPIFFGISQCLITVRLGITSPQSTEHPASRHTRTIGSGNSKGIMVNISRATTSDGVTAHPSVDVEKLSSGTDSERSSVTEV